MAFLLYTYTYIVELKTITIFYIVFLFLGCAYFSSCSNKTEESFIIKHYSISLDGQLKAAIFYKQRYYVLTKSGKLIVLLKDFKVDAQASSLVNKYTFTSIYILKEHLIGNTKSDDSLSVKYFLNSDKSWQQCDFCEEKSKPLLFKDESFEVSGCCVGEFGASIFFEESTSGKVYGSPVLCPIQVLKKNSDYYIISSLAHLSGFSQIVKVKKPNTLFEIKEDSLKSWCNWYNQIDIKKRLLSSDISNDYLSKYKVGTSQVLDTIGLLTVAAFWQNDVLYMLNSDSKGTYLNHIQNDRLKTIDTILKQPIRVNYSSHPNTGVYSFENRKKSGFIHTKNNIISVVSVE